jgi:hypothetical protein
MKAVGSLGRFQDTRTWAPLYIFCPHTMLLMIAQEEGWTLIHCETAFRGPDLSPEILAKVFHCLDTSQDGKVSITALQHVSV